MTKRKKKINGQLQNIYRKRFNNLWFNFDLKSQNVRKYDQNHNVLDLNEDFGFAEKSEFDFPNKPKLLAVLVLVSVRY